MVARQMSPQCPPNRIEEAFPKSKCGLRSISPWDTVTGTRCSCLRAELQAGIPAISADGPVHIATDSMSFKLKADRILAGECLTARRPWAIQPDGDLWDIFEKAV